MIEKIKAIGDSVKTVVGYILVPFFLLGGLIYALFMKNQNLKDDLKRSEADAKLKELNSKLGELTKDGDAKEAEYKRLRAEYKPDGDSGDV